MPVDLSNHPQYQVKAAKYNADKSAATTAGDQAQISVAESEWAQARAEMTMELVDRQANELTRQTRLAAIKAAKSVVKNSQGFVIGQVTPVGPQGGLAAVRLLIDLIIEQP